MTRSLYRTMTGQTFEIRISPYGFPECRHYAEVFEVVPVAGRFAHEMRIARYNGLRAGELFVEALLADIRGRSVAETLSRAAGAVEEAK
jgi:hypothetical protein